MNDNYNYVLNNLKTDLTNEEWLKHIKKYFGEEETKKFCEYIIDARNICRKNDIRNMLYSGSMSIFSLIDNEQLAILNYFRPIDTENIFVKNIGLDKIKTKYNKKDMELDEKIKKHGYSYTKTNFYFKSENVKNTFQLKYINIVCSEKNTENEFLENMCDIAKIFKQKNILITDKIPNIKTPKMIIKGKIYNTETKEVIEEIDNITIETIEKYLTKISDAKVMHEVPYINNKKIIEINDTKSIIDLDYYSKEKQERVKIFKPYSVNTAILKMGLLKKFSLEDNNK